MAADGLSLEALSRIAGGTPAGASRAHIAYFGHDSRDAAIRRRVATLLQEGFTLTGFMMHRRDADAPDWDNLDLGRTADAAFAQRARAILAGAVRAAADPRLARADLILARNLDMLACAFEARRRARLTTPVVYECLDVHRLLCRKDPIGVAMRAVERRFLSRTAGLIVSSPGFVRHHFERRHGGKYRAYLVENRLSPALALGPRPARRVSRPEGPLRLGWVGNLRCRRSFHLLLGVADRLGEAIEIHLHGAPARTEIPVFEPEIARRANVTYHGRYRAPDDLPGLYAGLDLVWSGDFMEAGFNSVWLLPNRLYEGGYFGVPPLAPEGTETARWIAARDCGFLVDEPLETALADRLGGLASDRGAIEAARESLLARPASEFVAPEGEIGGILDAVLSAGVRP